MVYQLHNKGVYLYKEIEPFLSPRDTFLLCYYFHKEIKDFNNFIKNKKTPYDFDESLLENPDDIDQMIEYGFIKTSIEYSLKYDVIENVLNMDNLNQKARWSPFEWSFKPDSLDLFSFSGFFGSIKCFKYLLMKGFEINDYVVSMVVCSGCLDIYHLCQGQSVANPILICKSSQFFCLPLLVFMLENGMNINAKESSNEYMCLIGLLFIGLPKMVI